MINILAQRSMKHGYRAWLGALRLLRIEGSADVLYFAYGANLNLDRLQRKGVFAENLGPASLRNYRLSFSLPCEYQGKGFANVEPAEAAEVWGLLLKMSPQSLRLLDIMEWVSFGFYHRENLMVHNTTAEVAAWVYVAKTKDSSRVPSLAYLKYVHESAKANQLPQTYLDSLDVWPCRSSFELDPEFCLSNPARRRWGSRKLRRVYLLHDRLREKLATLIP